MTVIDFRRPKPPAAPGAAEVREMDEYLRRARQTSSPTSAAHLAQALTAFDRAATSIGVVKDAFLTLRAADGTTVTVDLSDEAARILARWVHAATSDAAELAGVLDASEARQLAHEQRAARPALRVLPGTGTTGGSGDGSDGGAA